MLEYEGARIQLLDLPGIVQDAAKGRGRGRQVVSVAKTADLIVLMSKLVQSDWHPAKLTNSRCDENGRTEEDVGDRAGSCRDPSEHHTT